MQQANWITTMMTSTEPSSARWQEILKSVFRKASYDEAFRALCLQDPQEMLRKHYGVEMDSGYQVQFSESADGDALVLPPLAQITLQDEDLKIVADGAEMKLARYENWGSEKVTELFKHARYENWGGE